MNMDGGDEIPVSAAGRADGMLSKRSVVALGYRKQPPEPEQMPLTLTLSPQAERGVGKAVPLGPSPR